MSGEDETRCTYSYTAWDGALWVCILGRDHPSRWDHQLRLVVDLSREAVVQQQAGPREQGVAG